MTSPAAPAAPPTSLPLLNPAHPALWYGGDYNPEQWPEEVWAEDVRLMREAGVNLATVGVFAWSRLEPRPGQYDFGWLDRVLDLLHAHGIRVCLATATAAPPPWFTHAHPESVPVRADGTRYTYGSRQCYSPASRAYRDAAAALAGRIAARYARHPAVVAWHINNELGCHVSQCFGEESAGRFRAWLFGRYGSLAALNEAWGTLFWSQQYSDWEEVNPPRQTPYLPNGAQVLDFQRFCSDLLLDIYLAELAAVRSHSFLPVTTNLMGFHRPCDYFSWAPKLDFISWDAYPEPSDEWGGALGAGLNHDLMRSLRRDRPFLLMEQAVASTNWNATGETKPPGRMRSLSYQALARGADGILFFQWRTSRYGMEKFLPGLVPHGGVAGSRTWREVCALGAELGLLGEISGSAVRGRVGLVVSWPNRWAIEQAGKPQTFDYSAEVRRLYGALWRQGLSVDFVSPQGGFSGYEVLLVPSLYQLGASEAAALREFVNAGGTVIATYATGVVDEHERAHLGGYPGPLRDMFGLAVEDWWACTPGVQWRGELEGQECQVGFWSEAIHPRGATVIGTYREGPLAGRPLALRHRFGRGEAYYVGGRLESAEVLEAWLRTRLAALGVTREVLAPAGVEVVRRDQPGHSYLFVINHRLDPVEVQLPEGGNAELLSGLVLPARAILAPAGVWIIRRDCPSHRSRTP